MSVLIAGAPAAPAAATPASLVKFAPVVVPRTVGYVYAGGATDLLTYRQTSDGALTNISDAPYAGPFHSLVLIHLLGGRLALYDLRGTYGNGSISGFHVNPATGVLTADKALSSATLPGAYGLGGYDPLSHAQPGGPMLVTTACTTVIPQPNNTCDPRLAWFHINPVTGALSTEAFAPPASGRNDVVSQELVGDGLGRFAFTARHYIAPGSSGPGDVLFMASVNKLGTGIGTIVIRTLSDGGTSPQTATSPLYITPTHYVQLAVSPLKTYKILPGGLASYAFGYLTAAPFESEIDAGGPTAITGVPGHTAVAEEPNGGTLPTGYCGLEQFGQSVPGLGGVIMALAACPYYGYPTPATFVTSMYDQAGYLYVGRYGTQSLGYHDGTGSSLPTSQGTIPVGAQVYGWTGFVLPPAVPTAPRGLHATFPSAAHTIVTWLPPLKPGGAPIARYMVRWSVNAKTWTAWASTGLVRRAGRVGLPKGKRAWIEVLAVNAGGNGPLAALAFVPTR